MYKNSKSLEDKYSYTMVYFDIWNDFDITLNDYIVLDAIRFFCKHNTLTVPITGIADNVKLSRTTIYESLDNLLGKELITRDNDCKEYYLNPDIEHKWGKKERKYIVIYHKDRKEKKLSVAEYGIFYLLYSFSLTNGYARGSANTYTKLLHLKERHYFNTKKKLKALNLIWQDKKNIIVLSKSAKQFFKESHDKNVQKMHPIKKCPFDADRL
ncbi:MAG: hypothetical protein JWN78_641 [Bacteroidota bacterium]|nr:hypothetical protein [Bacteroidota bacterium]